MNRYNTFIIFCFAILITACHHNDPVPADPLNRTWTVNAVSLDGVSQTTRYANMVIAFASGNYTVTNAVAPVWPPSGLYDFKDQIITRNDGVAIQVLELSSTKLVLQFHYDAKASGGRLSQVSGIYKFELTAR